MFPGFPLTHNEAGDFTPSLSLNSFCSLNMCQVPRPPDIKIDNYAWVVPFRDAAEKRILITAYPSRKFTAEYLGGDLK
jgi:hypothetical protein